MKEGDQILLANGLIELTDKDRQDLIFCLENDLDYVALSFVRTAEDVLRVKEIIQSRKKGTPVIAKIKKHEAIEHIDEIMTAGHPVGVPRTTNMVRVKML